MNEFDRVRDALLDSDGLIRAVASGRRREGEPPWRRVECRYVDLTAGRRLQVTRYDATQAFTTNYDDAVAVVYELLELPFGSWHVETTTETVQVRVTRKGKVLTNHRAATVAEVDRSHDRSKQRMLAPDNPVFFALGLSDEDGRIKPSRQAKYRQVDEFLRALSAAVDDALAAGVLHEPTNDRPWQVVDLGCGNAYLTFAAEAWLDACRRPAFVTGVDVKEQSSQHNSAIAAQMGVADRMAFVVGTIGEASVARSPDIVLALHACDTATDDALARAIGWDAPVVLAAPCCHHDVAKQLRRSGAPAPYDALVRDGILRERLADTLTDAIRALLLRSRGYRVDVVEFIESAHTPRNTLIRALRTGSSTGREEYEALVEQWHLRPKLAELLEQLELN